MKSLALLATAILVLPPLALADPVSTDVGAESCFAFAGSSTGLPLERHVIGFEAFPEDVAVGDVYGGGRVVHLDATLRFVAIETSTPALLNLCASLDDNVRYAEPSPVENWIEFVPNDPKHGATTANGYGPSRIGALAAWDVTRGSTAVKVCVGDTGVRMTHEDLAGRYVGGWDFINGDASPADDHGHGSHVTGTIAATIHNAKGIAGMAQASFQHVKVLNALGSGSTDVIASGIRWCVDNGAHVVSLSLGGGGTTALHDAVRYATNRGVLVVAAAGNDGSSLLCGGNCVGHPAKYPEALAVACTDRTDARCSFSSPGPEVDVAAPGYQIESLGWTTDSSYAIMSGTSMSTPHVAGAAALVKAANPTFTGAQIRNALETTAQDLGAVGRDNNFGLGLVRVDRAIGAAPPPAENLPPTASFTTSTSGLTVSTDAGASADTDGTIATYAWAWGDGAMGGGATASHAYTAAGTYTITLTVTDDDGATATTTRSVAVSSETPPPPPPDGNVRFGDKFESGLGKWVVSDAAGTGKWAQTATRAASPTRSAGIAPYGAGSNDLLTTAEAVSLAGLSQPKLTFKHFAAGEATCSFFGCTNYDYGRVQVSADSGATFATIRDTLVTTNGAWSTETITLDAYAGQSILVRFAWKSDGSVQNEGWYVDDVEISGATSEPNAPPSAAFTTWASGLTASADASASNDADGTIASYAWSWGDGATGAGRTASHAYAAAGTYTITLTVTDDDGATDTESKSVTVSQPSGGVRFEDDMESGAGKWTVVNSAGTSAFSLTTYKSGSPTRSFGIGGASGYGANENDALRTASAIDLAGAATAKLEFKHYARGESAWDYGTVQISTNGGSTWTTLTGFTRVNNAGDANGLAAATAALDAYVGKQILLQFTWKSDGSIQNEGWFVDDVRVSAT